MDASDDDIDEHGVDASDKEDESWWLWWWQEDLMWFQMLMIV